MSTNKLAMALYPHLGVGDDVVRALFFDPQMRSFYRNWEKLTAWTVSFIRALLGQHPDPALTALIDELTERSPQFRQLWARHGVTQEALGVPKTGHRFVAYWAEPGSPSEGSLRPLADS
ncbi:hypothetical protein A5724_12700 [Mycobacterium sp. ACS1612]|nr:hypothetical protein A5724_12700 [Mycobacterium sp. ACS1612]